MSRQHEGEVSAGRMSDHDHACCIDGILLRKHRQEAIRGLNVAKRTGPATASIPDAAVFDVQGRDASSSEGRAEVAGVDEIVLRPPEASVDDESGGVSTPTAGNAQICKLVRIFAINDASVSGWRGFSQDVFAGHVR